MLAAGEAVLRPAQLSDANGVLALSMFAKPGLTSLPKELDHVEDMISHSMASFAKTVTQPGNEYYFFVLEHMATQTIIGTCSIYGRVGMKYPFYYYQYKEYDRYSPVLDIRKSVKLIELCESAKGPSEVGTLFLHPKWRKNGLGRLLSLARFLFVAAHPHRFTDDIISEMRGISREDGYCPFWESLGKRFFQMPFPDADVLSSRNKEFIADLMPKYPIYLEFLSEEAQSVIGKPHPETAPAMALLLKQGFEQTNQVDIFDAGPKLSAKWRSLAIVSKRKAFDSIPIANSKSDLSIPYIVCSGNNSQWRATTIFGNKTLGLRSRFRYNSGLDQHYLNGKTSWVSPLYANRKQTAKIGGLS